MPTLCKFGRRVAAVVFVVVLGLGLAHYSPPLPSEITMQVVFPADRTGETEPIVTSGVSGAGDFLRVRYTSERTVVFEYDTWRIGGPSSPPIAVEPGSRHQLRIVMPSLLAVRGNNLDTVSDRLHVRFDNRVVLDAPVRCYQRELDQFYFAENPLGGPGNALFQGKLFGADGRPLRGGSRAYFPFFPVRLAGWLTQAGWQVLGAALLGLAAGFGSAPIWRWRQTRPTFVPVVAAGPSVAAGRWGFAITASLCAVIFANISTGGSYRLVYPELFGSFYDYQAVSLLHGRLDVPPEAIAIEAFVFQGRSYGYFGPTPALWRIPFVVFGVGFGQLSRCFMLAYYLAALLAAYRMLHWAHVRAHGDRAPPSAWAVVVFTLGVGLGTTLFFLSSRAFIYHEAILCGATLALWSAYCSLRYLDKPDRRWWLGALVCGTLAIHARPTVGLFALTLTGCIAARHLVAAWRRRHRWTAWRASLGIGVLSVAAALSFNGVSYLKFRSFGGMPLRLNFQYDSQRLNRIDEKNFHWCNLANNFDAYLLTPAFALRPNFPFFYIDGSKSPQHPEAKIDLAEPTLAVPYAMPAVFLLAFVGGAYALWRVRSLRPPILLLAASVGPMALAMLTAVVISQRYTADFCPFLIGAAACGLAAIDTSASRWRPVMLALLSGLAVLSVGISLALTLHYQGAIVWGTQQETVQRYQQMGKQIDGFFHLPPPKGEKQ